MLYWWAGITAFLYYTTALWPAAAASYLFFHFTSVVAGAAIVVLFSTLLSLPWWALWKSVDSRASGSRATRLLFALGLAALPPIGLFGVAHPLTATGVVLPATGFAGLMIIGLTYIAWFHNRPLAILALSLVALLTHFAQSDGTAPPPPGWIAINTNFGSVWDALDPVSEFEAAEFIQRRALSAHAHVIVFPEGRDPALE